MVKLYAVANVHVAFVDLTLLTPLTKGLVISLKYPTKQRFVAKLSISVLSPLNSTFDEHLTIKLLPSQCG